MPVLSAPRWVVIAALWTLPAAASAQDLGAAAQEEQARRERNRASGVKTRVIAPREIRTAPKASPSPAARATPAAPAAEDITEVRKARGAALKPQLQAAERALQSAAAAVARVQAQIETLNRTSIGGYTNGDGGKVALRRDLEQAQERLRWAKEYRDSIEDTARRERIPPGYLR